MKRIPTLNINLWLNTVRFIDGEPTIYCRLTIQGKRTEISMQRSIPKENWSKGKAIGNSQKVRDLNEYLSLYKAHVLKVFNHMIAMDEHITAESLKKALVGVEEEKKTFVGVYQRLLLEFKQKAEKGNRSMRTHKRLEISRNKFIQFLQEEKKCSDILLEKITIAHAHDFEHWLTVKNNLSHNTAMKYIKINKQALEFAVKKCMLEKNPFKDFRCTYEEPKVVVLEQHELDHMWNHEMPQERLHQVRDIYVFCCYTGFAFSDAMDLQPDNIYLSLERERWICKNRNKTDTAENVMLLPIPEKIIEKYHDHPCRKIQNRLLPQLSNQRFNGYLKEIASICGINKPLTSHTARFTFATTVTLENDVPIESVSRMLGHNSIRTTQRYAKVTKRKLTNNMQNLRAKLNISENLEVNKVG